MNAYIHTCINMEVRRITTDGSALCRKLASISMPVIQFIGEAKCACLDVIL